MHANVYSAGADTQIDIVRKSRLVLRDTSRRLVTGLNSVENTAIYEYVDIMNADSASIINCFYRSYYCIGRMNPRLPPFQLVRINYNVVFS